MCAGEGSWHFSAISLCQVINIMFLAPSSSPTSITVVSTTTTSITVNWVYDTSDADGYVVYYNGTAKLVVGDIKETTLDRLIPGTSYSITVRAYQDILGPPSTTLNTATDDGKSMYMLVPYSTIITPRPPLPLSYS